MNDRARQRLSGKWAEQNPGLRLMLRQPGPGPREMQRDLTQEANAGYGGDVPEQKPTTDMAPDKRLRLRSITFKCPSAGLGDPHGLRLKQRRAAASGHAADRPVEPSAHEASTGVAEKEPLKRQEPLSKNWRLTPAMIAACDAARDRALGYLLRKLQ
jgi:hypothetical protein